MPVITLQTVFGKQDIFAECDGSFAIHLTLRGEPGQHNVSHAASGFAILERVTYEQALAAVKELKASGLDWTLKRAQASLTLAHKDFGRVLRAKYPSDPIIHRQVIGGHMADEPKESTDTPDPPAPSPQGDGDSGDSKPEGDAPSEADSLR